MTSLDALITANREVFDSAWAGKKLQAKIAVKQEIEQFFSDNGFINLTLVSIGTSSVVLGDADNPAIVFRIGPRELSRIPGARRAVIPQLIQPLYAADTSIGFMKIEILPNISVPESRKNSAEFRRAVGAYREEMAKSGYTMDTISLENDVGEFSYPDPDNLTQTKKVIMGTDPGLVTTLDTEGKPPTCTSGYPDLNEQWKVQCEMVKTDPRLQMLIGIPKKFPPTQVINTTSLSARTQ